MAASNARAVEAEAINVELIGTLEAAVSEVTKLENQLQSQTSMFTAEKQRLQEQLTAKDNELADAVGLMEVISKSAKTAEDASSNNEKKFKLQLQRQVELQQHDQQDVARQEVARQEQD